MEAVGRQVDIRQRPSAPAPDGVEHPHAAVELHCLEQVGRHARADVAGAGVDDDLANLGRRRPNLTEGRDRRPLRQGGRPAGESLHPPVRVLVFQGDDVELRIERQIPGEDARVRKDLFQHIHAAFGKHVAIVGPHQLHTPCLGDTDRWIGNPNGRDPDRWRITGKLTHESLTFRTHDTGRLTATEAPGLKPTRSRPRMECSAVDPGVESGTKSPPRSGPLTAPSSPGHDDEVHGGLESPSEDSGKETCRTKEFANASKIRSSTS